MNGDTTPAEHRHQTTMGSVRWLRAEAAELHSTGMMTRILKSFSRAGGKAERQKARERERQVGLFGLRARHKRKATLQALVLTGWRPAGPFTDKPASLDVLDGRDGHERLVAHRTKTG